MKPHPGTHEPPRGEGFHLARLEIFELTPSRLQSLSTHLATFEPGFDQILDSFYARLEADSIFQQILENQGQMQRLREANLGYLRSLFSPEIDADQVNGRLRMGRVHHRLRIYPQWYLSAYIHLIDGMLSHLVEGGRTEDAITLVKRVLFDMSLSLDAYGMGLEEELKGAGIKAAAPSGDPRPAAPPSTAPPAPEVPRARLKVEANSANERSVFLGLDADEIERLRSLAPTIVGAIPSVLEEFYAFFSSHPETERLVPPATAGRLQEQVASYWREFTEARFDRPYATSRIRIGMVHERIGLTPQWYLAGLSRQLSGLISAIAAGEGERGALTVTFFRAVLFDITFVIDAYMESRADTVLRTEGYASRLVASLTEGVAVLDARRNILSVNQSMLEFLAVEAALLHHMPISSALPMPEVETLLDSLAESGENRLSLMGRFNGSILRLTAVLLDSGPEGQIALVIDDVTHLKRVADDLERDTLEMETIVDSLPDMLWAAEIPSWTLLSVSRQALSLTGRREMALLGRSDVFLQCIHPEDREQFCHHFGSVAVGFGAEWEHRVVHPDGSIRWVHTRVRRIPQQKDRLVIAGTTRDITAVRTERKLRHDTVEQLVGGVAHEINNALTVVMGELHFIDSEEGSAAAARDRALGAGRRMAQLTRHLLAFAERQVLTAAGHDLAVLLREWKKHIESIAEGGMKVFLDCPAEPVPVHLDRSAFEACLWQLFGNAMEATGGAGELRLRLEYPPGRDFVSLEISDNGHGMEPEVIERACDPFFSTRPGLAAGLGLSMVRGFMNQSGGRVEIASEPGVGTTVGLYLPVMRSQIPEVAPEPTRGRSRHPVLLLVEDEELIRNLVLRVAKRLNFRVEEAETAEEAFEIVERVRVDAVFSDIMLGKGMDGVSLVRELQKRWQDLPVVLTSGYAAGQFDLAAGLKLTTFIAKPFSLDDLRTALLMLYAAVGEVES